MLTADEPSLLGALGKQLASLRAGSGAWLDIEAKLELGQRVLAARWARRRPAYRGAAYRDVVDRYFAPLEGLESPELTEVSLATLLTREGLEFEAATYAELHADPARRRRLLDRTELVFASSTLLRDLSEVAPMLAMLRRPGNKLVAGGALAGLLHGQWTEALGADVLAVGYGERLVPSLAAWARSGFRELRPPPGGRIERRGGFSVLHAGPPVGLSLDELEAPDWALAERYHQRRFRLVKYESVRGCPYRCEFCNYPFLFDDTKFRHRSAERIDRDWQRLEAGGAEFVSCLDSLFTMPKRRLVELCERLIARGSRLRWICYARADDLADPAVVERMREAGCVQVHIGIESGSQRVLDAMNKRVTVAANQRALENCRRFGITSFATFIIGFPGSRREDEAATLEFLRRSPPDLHYLAAFNTRFEGVPILAPARRAATGLEVAPVGRSGQPYWRHHSMSCTEVGEILRTMSRAVREERRSLDAGLFLAHSLRFCPEDRDALLDFQRDAASHGPLTERALGRLRRFVAARLAADVAATFSSRPPAALSTGPGLTSPRPL